MEKYRAKFFVRYVSSCNAQKCATGLPAMLQEAEYILVHWTSLESCKYLQKLRCMCIYGANVVIHKKRCQILGQAPCSIACSCQWL
jgi:hypothetical protein